MLFNTTQICSSQGSQSSLAGLAEAKIVYDFWVKVIK